MRMLERRLVKVESASGRPDDLRSMSDEQLEFHIRASLTEECRAGKTLEEIVASYRDDGHRAIADMIVSDYFWDPETQTVKEKRQVERGA